MTTAIASSGRCKTRRPPRYEKPQRNRSPGPNCCVASPLATSIAPASPGGDFTRGVDPRPPPTVPDSPGHAVDHSAPSTTGSSTTSSTGATTACAGVLGRGDYAAFLETMGDLKQRRPFMCHGYCLMPNHVHPLIRPLESPISRIMQSLLVSHTQRHHRRHHSGGHVWQGRFRSPVIPGPCGSGRLRAGCEGAEISRIAMPSWPRRVELLQGPGGAHHII